MDQQKIEPQKCPKSICSLDLLCFLYYSILICDIAVFLALLFYDVSVVTVESGYSFGSYNANIL